MTQGIVVDHVFPAHAGMFLDSVFQVALPVRFPRARGDVPENKPYGPAKLMFSPRTRGCSFIVLVALVCDRVFPAHAGMFLYRVGRTGVRSCFPRARGDVPETPKVAAVGAAFSPRTRGCSV